MTPSESHVLGACLRFPAEALPAARRIMQADDFSTEGGRVLFNTAGDLWDAERALDLDMVSDALKRVGKLEAVGGDAGLTALYDGVATAATVPYHARAIREATDRSRLADALAESADLVRRDGLPLPDLRAGVMDRIARVCTVRGRDCLYSTADLADLLAEPQVPGLCTGLEPVDRALDGLQPEHLIVPAGRPGIGKTSLGVAWSAHITQHPAVRVLFVSCEMAPREIARWFLACVSGVPRDAVGPAVVATARAKLETRGFFVAAPSAPTIAEVQATIRAAVASHNVGVAFVDHLGKLRTPGAESRTQEVGTVARGLKAIAKELAIPVVALCQLNRGPEGRDDKRPRLADLRDCGEIEQEADAVLFLWATKPEYRKGVPRPVTLTLEKNRHGSPGEWSLLFHREAGRFEMARERPGDGE